ncbi:hypothetical protein [Zwartia sp.]|uniref:hypothetical protein n=1 Tax=Zwartia sp. TaxID=2978004 RepID=UPI002723C85F|nr:hypothetical protein [Zwartia sp.]MDO9026010.1 hypothetical protein [Zwartia sp.]
MRIFYQSVLGATILALLVGCSSPDKPKVVKEMPERPAVAVFKGMSNVQVKNSLMSACSQDRLYIQPDLNEVTCVRHKLNSEREQMLINIVNDEYARRITDNVKFVITTEGRDVRVVGNAYVQYASPLGIEIDAGSDIKRVNLIDNASFSLLENILKQAGATLQ